MGVSRVGLTEILHPFDQTIISDFHIAKKPRPEELDSMNSKFVSITQTEFLSHLNSHLASIKQKWKTPEDQIDSTQQDFPGHSLPETDLYQIGFLLATPDPDMPKRTKNRSSSRRLERELNKISSAKTRYKNKMQKMYEEAFIKEVIDADPEWYQKYQKYMLSCADVIQSKFEEYDQVKSQVEYGYGITRNYSRRRLRSLQLERQASQTDSDTPGSDLSDSTICEAQRSLHASTEQESS